MFVDPYLATITNFGGNFAPRSWMFCQGQLLSIAEYSALFALIGTTYGGDGQTTFGLPDLRGRVAIHMGQGPGLSMYVLGEISGTESVTLNSAQLPGHNHGFVSITGAQPGSTAGGANSSSGTVPGGGYSIYTGGDDGNPLGASQVNTITIPQGSNSPVSIIQPYQSMNYIIAVEGIFPSRN